MEALTTVAKLSYNISCALTALFIRRLTFSGRLSLSNDLKRSVFRCVFLSLPIKSLRGIVHKGSFDHVLKSNRYSSVGSNLFQEVATHDFRAYWICQCTLEKPAKPSTSDVVILFAHGGGYVIGDVPMHATFLLAVAETIRSQGKTVSIFSVDYPTAPEKPFPAALLSITAAYEYLVRQEHIDSSKIVCMGDSAGGNLCLSLLAHLHNPLPTKSYFDGSTVNANIIAVLPKTVAGAVLISPWVSLNNTHDSFRRNADTDVFTKGVLDHWAALYRAKDPNFDGSLAPSYTEFANTAPDSTKKWLWLKDACPKMYVTAGTDELFFGDIADFAAEARKQGVDVTFHAEEGREHDWQMVDVAAEESKFLKCALGDAQADKLFTAPKDIGKAILGMLV